MKIALIYDRVNKFGGAERVLLALHEIWPSAPIYTAIYNPSRARWSKFFRIIPSFMNKLPFSSTKHEIFPLLTPYAFESFNFDNYDVVISITSSDAKAIVTKPTTLHICYCLTPTRYLWSGYALYRHQPGVGIFNPFVRFAMNIFSPQMRMWDYILSHRPDRYIAISQTVAKRINSFYKRTAVVIYPPIDTKLFHPPARKKNSDYYLIVSRLVPYKKIDYAVAAFNQLGWKLKIIGGGIDADRLKKHARKNIEFVYGDLTDEKLCWYYQNCKALIFPGEEDFGLTSVEAQACGTPVIGYGIGGVSETIFPGKTGEIYVSQTTPVLIATVIKSRKKYYNVSDCRNNALRFSKQLFQKKIKNYIEDCWNYRRINN